MKKRILIPVASILAFAAAAGLWPAMHSRGASGPHAQASQGDHGNMHATGTMYNCAMHPQYISGKPGNCPICGMRLTPMDKGKGNDTNADGAGIHIDPAMMQSMGVRTERVEKRDLRTEVRAGGKVEVDESRLTVVNARVMGYAEKVNVNVTGRKVIQGQSLLEIYSPDLVSTQEEYLQALRYARAAGAEGTGSGELLESARRRLLNWGISPGEIGTLERLGHARNTLAIASPVSGVVLEKTVVQGQNIMPGTGLYKIADLSKVWVVAAIYQRDLGTARLGSEADVEINYLPGKPFKGKVAFLSPVLDEQTRTAEVRIEVRNTPELDLKPGMLATVRILSAAHENVVAVPEQAIIRSGRRTLAIIAMDGGRFEPREVRLGAAADGYVEILEGLHEGENLVVSSQFLIDSESNLKTAIRQLKE